MKKLAIVFLLVAVSCRRKVEVRTGAPTNEAGAPTARAAVTQFLAAAKAQDLQAMGNVWGTTSGPIAKTIGREEVEKREVILLCYLKYDSYQILSEAPAPNGERVFAVENTFKDLTRKTNFYSVLGPANRWYVRAFENEALRDICAKK